MQLLDAFSNLLRLFDGAAFIGIRHQQGEGSSAVPGGNVIRAGFFFEQVCQLSQDNVAGLVAEEVVILLEVVNVHDDQSEGNAPFGAIVYLPDQDVPEVAVVVKAGQTV